MTAKRQRTPKPARSAAARLTELDRIRAEFGPGWPQRKRALLDGLERARLASARAVAKLHELLIFLRAYPDDRALLEQVERMLAGFEQRSDLREFRAALADSGIAGTTIHFPFFAETAWRLAARFPGNLELDWDAVTEPDRLERWLPFVAHPAEAPGLDEIAWSPGEWLDRMRGSDRGGTPPAPPQGDGAFFLRRLRTAIPDPQIFERVVDDLGLSFRLAAGPATPARTRERLAGAPSMPHRSAGDAPICRGSWRTAVCARWRSRRSPAAAPSAPSGWRVTPWSPAPATSTPSPTAAPRTCGW